MGQWKKKTLKSLFSFLKRDKSWASEIGKRKLFELPNPISSPPPLPSTLHRFLSFSSAISGFQRYHMVIMVFFLSLFLKQFRPSIDAAFFVASTKSDQAVFESASVDPDLSVQFFSPIAKALYRYCDLRVDLFIIC